MPGRRLLVTAALCSTIAFGGGAALAASHQSSHPAGKTPGFAVRSNVHYPCRKHGSPQGLL
jgi:hypothetical protein